MSFDAVIFDLDGTLVDSLADIASAMNAALGERGLPVHLLADYRHLVGEGVQRLVQRALPRGREELAREVLALYQRRYAERLLATTRPYPGVLELLAELSRREVRLAVLSNKPQAATQAIVEAFFACSTFHAVHGERPEVPRKPDPTGALQIAQLLAMEAAQIAFVGDTPVDMETARNAGMFPVGVLWGLRGREELESHGAKALISAPGELLHL